MTRITPSWIVAIALTGILHLSYAQNPAYVPTAIIGATIGSPTNFTCQSHGIPIGTCLWERDAPAGSSNSNGLILNFNPSNSREGEGPQPGYTYLGDGLEKGECGVVIQNVKDTDNGNWKCTLITNTGQLYRGVVELGIMRKPEPPQFNPNVLNNLVDSDDSQFRDKTNTRVVCFSANGQPPPRLQWFIDNEPLTEGLSPINTTINNRISYTYQELVNHRFTWKDNGKKLRCVLQHDALGSTDNKEAVIDLDISYAPRSAREDGGGNHVEVRAEIGAEKVLSVNVSANPKPDSVTWTVDGKTLREKESTEKYEALELVAQGAGIYQAILRIKSVEEEDVNKHFILKVSNNFGDAEFDLQVASEATGSGGLSAGGIVLLILGIAALIIIIALVVVYARSQGLLCFKGDDGTASEKERMDGGSTGVGAGDEPQPQQKPGLKLTSRLSALYDNLLNKKKDKPVPVDEESATKEKEPVQESSSPVKPPGTPANPPPGDSDPATEKKPEDIVYAELDLARSGLATGGGNGPQPEIVVKTDDKTEYAEIVGVVSAGKVEEAKRSPSASNKSGGSATEN